MINAIACVSQNLGLGFKNKLLFNIPEDMKFFIEMTDDSVVVMGFNTFVSIGSKGLNNRINIVITRRAPVLDQSENVRFVDSIGEAINLAESYGKDVFIIGGESIYKQALPYVERIYITFVYKDMIADTYFPSLPKKDWIIMDIQPQKDLESPYFYEFLTYERRENNGDIEKAIFI
jgi:dihydrofolate reductase